MPIYVTSGIEEGELRFFEVQHLKIKPIYKKSCNFYWIRRICGTKEQ
jgi:hypothetical protein